MTAVEKWLRASGVSPKEKMAKRRRGIFSI
jgi:hypothetical protein